MRAEEFDMTAHAAGRAEHATTSWTARVLAHQMSRR
jgi:hypothetical protein